jgi:hypothetical protein
LEKTIPADTGKGTKTARYVVQIAKDPSGNLMAKPLYTAQ